MTPLTLRSRISKYTKKPSQHRIHNLSIKNLFKNLRFHLILRPSEASHIFLLGPSRSGTTLAQKILTSHPSICGIDGETFFFCKRRFDNIVLQDVPLGIAQDAFYLSRNKIEMFDRIASVVQAGRAASVFLEKTPEHALHLSELVRWYPNSMFVFMVRDGRDAYSSAMRYPEMQVKVGDRYPYLWRDCVRQFLRNRSAPQVILFRYEDLCLDPEGAIRTLMDNIGLAFDRRQIDPDIYSRTRIKAQQGHERLNEAISIKSVGQYRREGFAKEVAHFERVAASELKAMGYSVTAPAAVTYALPEDA